MSKTIEFGAFLNGVPNATRLAQAQRVASDLGVTVSANGTRFAGAGQGGDPIKVTVAVPDDTVLTTEVVAQGRDAFDALLSKGERLSDYALVKENGSLTAVVSLLTGEVKTVAAAPRVAAAAPASAAPRRWSPFRR